MDNCVFRTDENGRRKKPRTKRKPFIVRVGPIIITVYENADGTASIVCGVGKDRKVIHRNDYESSKVEATRMASELSKGNRELAMVSEQKLVYYQEQEKRLNGTPLCVAVDALLARSEDEKIKPATVPDLVADLLRELEEKKRNPGYKNSMRNRLGDFARRFKGFIHLVKTEEIEAWIKSHGGSVRYHFNLRSVIVTLFNFGRRKRALSQTVRTNADKVTSYTASDLAKSKKPVEIHTIEEMQKLLDACDKETLPLFVLGGFCGVRPSEITGEYTDHEPLRWEDIIWDEEQLEVCKQKIRSKGHRLVPMQNAAKILAAYRGKTGYIWDPHKWSHKPINEVYAKAGVRKKRDALRHSFISYRVAQTGDVKKVALEAGNSENEIWTSYNNPRLKSAALLWFSLLPSSMKNAVAPTQPLKDA